MSQLNSGKVGKSLNYLYFSPKTLFAKIRLKGSYFCDFTSETTETKKQTNKQTNKKKNKTKQKQKQTNKNMQQICLGNTMVYT